MNGAATTNTSLSDAPGSRSGVGEEGSSNQEGATALPVVVAAGLDEARSDLSSPDTEFGTEAASVTATSSGLTRVDSLTLALQAIKARQAVTVVCLGPPTGGVDGVFLTARDAECGLLVNAGSLDKVSSSGSSGGEEDSRPKRASSLKLPNRPSNGLQPKKAVRFADAMGLDLALVRQVFDLDSPPVIPPQATRDLVLPPSDDEFSGDEDGTTQVRHSDQKVLDSTEKPGQQPRQQLYLSPSFAQPGSAPNFSSRVAAQKVVLEKAYFHMATPATTSAGGHVRGLVRVANLGFEKAVRVKATFDAWLHCVEVGADYQPGGGCGNSDQFAFSVALPEDLKVGDRVAFCVAYAVNGQTYWDSNFGDNYAFHCVAINSAGRGLSDAQEHALARYI